MSRCKKSDTHHEGLKMARLLMVLSSVSPLFIFWAIRGSDLFPNAWFIAFCLAMTVLPNTFLWFRIRAAKKTQDKRPIYVGTADDHRDHLLVYLFAMLLPFYLQDFDNWRYFGAVIAALAFVVFLFWHLNLHYMNIVFAIRGFRIFTVNPPDEKNPFADKRSIVIITRRVALLRGDKITAYRLSDTVYLEV